jgi:spermidine synthase
MRILTEMHTAMRSAGFRDTRTLFVSPTDLSLWLVECNDGGHRPVRSGIFVSKTPRAKPFDTHYYNAEIHRAALAQPEFFRRALAEIVA